MKITDHFNSTPMKRRTVLILFMFLLIFLLFRLRNYPDLVEKYYSLSIYPSIRTSFQYLFNIIPFSLGDIIYLMILIFFIAGIIKILLLVFRKKIKKAGFVFLGIILNLQIAFLIFYLFWGLNYFRQPASQRLNLSDSSYESSELLHLSSLLIDSANSIRTALSPQEMQQSASDIYTRSVQAVQDLSGTDPAFRTSYPMIKSSILSPVLNYMGTAGYFNPFTGEAQINGSMPSFLKPFVACHEMAHQIGFGAEDEANFIGFLSAISSDDKLLRYSAYYLASQEFMTEVWKTDSTAFKMLKEKISKPVLEDFETERNYWASYQGNAAKLSSIFYDNYLKVNKQPEGLKTYNRMIKLSLAYYRKQGIL